MHSHTSPHPQNSPLLAPLSAQSADDAERKSITRLGEECRGYLAALKILKRNSKEWRMVKENYALAKEELSCLIEDRRVYKSFSGSGDFAKLLNGKECLLAIPTPPLGVKGTVIDEEYPSIISPHTILTPPLSKSVSGNIDNVNIAASFPKLPSLEAGLALPGEEDEGEIIFGLSQHSIFGHQSDTNLLDYHSVHKDGQRGVGNGTENEEKSRDQQHEEEKAPKYSLEWFQNKVETEASSPSSPTISSVLRGKSLAEVETKQSTPTQTNPDMPIFMNGKMNKWWNQMQNDASKVVEPDTREDELKSNADTSKLSMGEASSQDTKEISVQTPPESLVSSAPEKISSVDTRGTSESPVNRRSKSLSRNYIRKKSAPDFSSQKEERDKDEEYVKKQQEFSQLNANELHVKLKALPKYSLEWFALKRVLAKKSNTAKPRGRTKNAKKDARQSTTNKLIKHQDSIDNINSTTNADITRKQSKTKKGDAKQRRIERLQNELATVQKFSLDWFRFKREIDELKQLEAGDPPDTSHSAKDKGEKPQKSHSVDPKARYRHAEEAPYTLDWFGLKSEIENLKNQGALPNNDLISRLKIPSKEQAKGGKSRRISVT